ncbi:MAG: RsmB/NOP family class I SAM-dependent RNA methyltransferase, partial [Limisphaerales bacterium]
PGQRARFVNAVLRGYIREFDATKKLLGELKVSNPALAFSHPQWLVDKWEKLFGRENTRRLLEWNNTPPKNFARVNTLKTDAGKLLERWRDENVEYDFVRRDFLEGRGLAGGAAGEQPHYDPETTVFELKSHPALASLPSFCDGWFYVQDPSTLLAPLELAPRPGETILDLCAAPGGKTTFIAQLMGNSGKIIAWDISEERLKLLEKNRDRLGAKSVHLASGPFAGQAGPGAMNTSIGNGDEPFDKILIDAPCSNTGVLRRRVDLRWRISPGEIARLRNVQLELLNLAAPKLRREGALIYSTCSLEPEENSRVIEDFLEGHSEFKLELEREILPFRDGLDGAFIARLRLS